MGKTKTVEQCKHPNSRKTKALAKELKKTSNKQQNKLDTLIKQNLLAEKINWFKQRLIKDNCSEVTPAQLNAMIQEYLGRFNDELEQIHIKHSIGQRKGKVRNQHTGRENVIKMTKKREQDEYQGAGLEIPNVLDPKNVKIVLDWDGQLKFLQNIPLKRFSQDFLEEYEDKKFIA